MNGEQTSGRTGPTESEVRLGEALPPDADIGSLQSGGVTRFRLAPEHVVSLSTGDGAHLEFLRFLRDCASWGLPVEWRATHDAAYPLDDITHLPPPVDAPVTRSAWAEPYQFGKLFWRNGPGFVTVKDTRVDDRAARFTIDDPPCLNVFLACQQPVEIATVPTTPEESAALDDLLAERLLMRAGDRVLCLAVRVRKFPIPYMSI